MHDVARIACVSQMTVSRVMRGTGYISKEVRDKVESAARSIGYVHNRLAGGMADYDNPLVGVIVPTLENRVFTEVLSGISDTLSEKGLRPVFGVSDYSLAREEELVFDLLSWRPRGLILSGLEHNEAVYRIVAQTGVRIAEIMDTDGEPISSSFGISQVEAAIEMADHLLSKGYKKFGYVSGLSSTDLRANKRLAAFQKRISECGGEIVATRIVEHSCSMLDGRVFTSEILANPIKPDAIYYANDDLAAGGLMHCLAEGLDVPGDVAIAGFNGLSFLSALPKQITTTKTPRYDIGVAAANWLGSDESDEQTTETQGFQTELIVGETT
ncbi:MAG: LacI family DNA-binding transcriptional regulator [Pseudomonadota bacterium]